MPSLHYLVSAATVVAAFFAVPATAQFGVNPGAAAGTGFEDMQAAAGVDAQGNVDTDALNAGMNAMNEALESLTPQQKVDMENFAGNMIETMDKLLELPADEIVAKVYSLLDDFSDPTKLQQAIGDTGVILNQLEESGMVTPVQIAKYRADPSSLLKEVQDMMQMFKSMMGTPEQTISMVQSLKQLMEDPNKALEMIGQAAAMSGQTS
eukprot:CAMPEP_0194345454 /NCGR_PEP_ID=MMETSP0171-20130528/104859_1 /TAXON_ID=218684 /ORGANISM="Corethron pennatum, Strain L29A3" /LENGTH=207 /DNA_ID=CAMNT_0039112431 /DNA_START=417 /DNA_END=1040 /DNA_ORIENTATION=-